MTTAVRSDARRLAEAVLDPEMPMLTLADLGVLRDVEEFADGSVVVTITPTYSGCPAMATMRDDIEHTLADAGYTAVEVKTVLSPPWSTDWISENGRRKLRESGYSTPGPAPLRTSGPVPLTLTVKPRPVTCPVCHSANTRLDSEFGATLCKALYRCLDCLEPFDHVKEI
ncbi:1,2-phenylacetyl-CoA epoxidase subunit PaaD [Rhodococcus jostii]|uniref:Ring-1,2-phenylacetyl-CoA epoxidase subunit PaaD n=1 Tax=Rhodococcus jostii TaxID=132919 RepID=A0A1H5FDT8_RHOJO|nr:1,2-phenylacetyl-CoA epoxidase subunit PaaD [Rhodococcus jostii]TQC45734.1 phenylacetate-CoA oxygenase subunit PaaJ [Rhodococcus sp. WS4]SEE01529.1 ring-1,2-phenylacetyl-CoA epoxidase subunit PaaD [Rhodococcus jostii]